MNQVIGLVVAAIVWTIVMIPIGRGLKNLGMLGPHVGPVAFALIGLGGIATIIPLVVTEKVFDATIGTIFFGLTILVLLIIKSVK